MKGIFGSLFSSGIIEKGAAMMGFNMPSWASSAIGIAGETFGGGGGSEAKESYIGSQGRYKKAGDLGASNIGTERMAGVGEQKASAAVEYQDELRDILAAVNLYAKGE